MIYGSRLSAIGGPRLPVIESKSVGEGWLRNKNLYMFLSVLHTFLWVSHSRHERELTLMKRLEGQYLEYSIQNYFLGCVS